MALPFLLFLACARSEEGDDDSVTEDSPPAFDPILASQLQEALDRSRQEIAAPGASVAVYLAGEGMWQGVSGEADLATHLPIDSTQRFRVGSITKTFVATVILQMEEEDLLNRGDLLAEWVPDAPYSDQVTLQHLLTHTAGYPDYVYTAEFLSTLDQPRTPEELLALIAGEPLDFAPGTDFSYSNTHYVLLGMVIGAVAGKNYAEEVSSRLSEPLSLDNTFLPSWEGTPDDLAHGYLGTLDEPIDVTFEMDASGPWAAGEIVSDAADLVRWASALYGGEVLTEASLTAMTTEEILPDGTGTGYGLGCYLDEVGGRVTFGHSGSTYGYQSRLRYREGEEGGEMVVATLVNNFFAEADEIDAALWEVLLGSEE